jgi:hypothetical protein
MVQLSPAGETERETEMTNEATKTNAGYSVKTVADRIIGMDIDAQGNGERAAWKQYLGYAHLAIAKGVSKKNMVTAVFGKDVKPSKNFDNMWSLAEKSHHNPLLLGNQAWNDIRVMGIDDALTAVIGLVNRHMATLNVGGKNAYGPLCGKSLEAIEAEKEQAEADAAQEAQATAAKLEADAESAKDAEAKAQDAASAKPERTPAEAAIGALADASRDDMMQVLAHIVTRLSVEDMAMVQEQLTAMVVNATAAAEPMALAS